MENTTNPYNPFAIKQGDKFTGNYFKGIVSIRSIDNETAVMKFHDERAKHLEKRSWLVSEIEQEEEKGNFQRLTSYRFRRKTSDGSFTRGFGFWEDMADRYDWAFVCQFLPDYERRDDVMISDDLACVIEEDHEYKDLAWLYQNYPQWKALNIEQLKGIQAQWDYEMQVEAEAYLTAAIQSGEIEVREFSVTYVSAKANSDITLQFADERWSNFGKQTVIPSYKLQHVKSRIVDGHFQIHHDDTWCNTYKQDFEETT